MSVNETTPCRHDYTANGGTDYPFAFEVYQAATVAVYLDGVLKAMDSDYRVRSGALPLSSVPASQLPVAGFIQFLNGDGTVKTLANGQAVALLSDQPIEQASAYTTSEAFPSQRLERDLDKTVMVSRMLDEVQRRTLRATPAEPLDMTLPTVASRKNNILGFTSQGAPTAVPLPTAGGGDVTLATVLATGSTIARTLGERCADWINVKDFGATGDGVTDDAAAIQNAINSIANGGVVFFPRTSASYGIGAAGFALTNQTDVALLGANGAQLKILAASTVPVGALGVTTIRLDTCTRVTIEGLTIDGNGKACNPIALVSCTDCVVRQNRVSTGGLNALVVSFGGTHGMFVHNHLSDSIGAARGLWVGNAATADIERDVLIDGNLVEDCVATGIVCTAIGGQVVNNVSRGHSAGSGIIASSSSASGGISERLVVANNICEDITGHGIQSDCALYGTDATHHLVVSGNICRNNSVVGIYAVNVRDWVILGNVCYDNGEYGIYVNAAKRVTVSSNTCYDSRSGGSRTQDVGIGVAASNGALNVEDVLLLGNLCRNHVQNGIIVHTATPGTLDTVAVNNNMCLDNSIRGISIAEDVAGALVNCAMVGNNAQGNTTWDIFFTVLNAYHSGNLYQTVLGFGNASDGFILPNNDTTPSVKYRNFWVVTNSGATTITMFDDGIVGQEILLLFTNANTTITDGGNIKLSAAFTSSADDTMRLVFNGTSWYEISRSVN